MGEDYTTWSDDDLVAAGAALDAEMADLRTRKAALVGELRRRDRVAHHARLAAQLSPEDVAAVQAIHAGGLSVAPTFGEMGGR